ncbi:MAG: LexA family protein [Fimbriimonas sp.]
MTQGQKLKRARMVLPGEPTQKAIDSLFGFERGRTGKYEQGPGPRGIPLDYRQAWEKHFGHLVPWSYIEDPRDNWPPGLGRPDHEEDLEVTPPAHEDDDELLYTLPYYGDVPAGDFDEDSAFKPSEEKVPKEYHKPGRFIRRIAGDSMAPALLYGDKVYFHRSTMPRDGAIVIAQNGNGRTVKVARFRPESRTWELEAFNKQFSFPLSEWEMVGYLVVVRRPGPQGLAVTFHHDQGIKPEMMPTTW